MQGLGPLHDELHTVFGSDHEPGPVHRLLARLPALLRERDLPYQLIVTTAFDSGVERAFADADEELDVVTYIGAGTLRGRFVHSPPGAEPRVVESRTVRRPFARARTVLLRLRGIADPALEQAWESLVVTEDDHIDYPGPSELEGAIPVTLAARLRRSHLLFLGYDLADWNLRLVVNRLRGGRPPRTPPGRSVPRRRRSSSRSGEGSTSGLSRSRRTPLRTCSRGCSTGRRAA